MKLRYYLRGLGMGILVCAMILSLANSKHNMTDAEIKKKAMELGMVEDDKSVLSSLVENPEIPKGDELELAEDKASDTKDTIENKTENPEQGLTDSKEETSVSSDAQVEAVNEPAEVQAVAAETETEKEKEIKTTEIKEVVVTIYPGEGSYTISKKLANLGLVESADVFDNYLCQNGYDKRLSTGNYTMTIGDTPEKIAKRLTGQ